MNSRRWHPAVLTKFVIFVIVGEGLRGRLRWIAPVEVRNVFVVRESRQ
jgi:hypothetical protein